MVIAAPAMVPEAAAAGQLFVSAENANFDNYFAGAQVVEIIVKDPNRISTEDAQSEPTVKVNEFPVRMAQGADGYWYAYIVESNEVAAANNNANLNFGTADADNTLATIVFNDAITVYPNGDGAANIVEQAPLLSPKNVGQISVTAADWPFIQALDFTLENIEIKLEQAGADEIVSLKHDNDDIDNFAGIELDRNSATNNAEVHLTITDQALNLDPTTEDVIVFNVR